MVSFKENERLIKYLPIICTCFFNSDVINEIKRYLYRNMSKICISQFIVITFRRRKLWFPIITSSSLHPILNRSYVDDVINKLLNLFFSARGKKKKKIKQLLPILLLLKLKLAALVPLFLGIIAFVAVKAVFLGKIAFAMNAFNLIKKLLAKGGHGGATISYASPHHHEEHQGYNYEPAQGWSSRQGDAASMAYSGQLRK